VKTFYVILTGLFISFLSEIVKLFYRDSLTKENVSLYFLNFQKHFESYDLIFIAVIAYLVYDNYKLNQPTFVAHSEKSIKMSEIEEKAKKKYKLLKSKNKIEEFSKVYANLKGTGGQLRIDDIQLYINHDLITPFVKHPLTGTFYKLTPTAEKVNEIIHD